MQRDARAAEGTPVDELITVDPATGLKILPHWVAQPYFRARPQVAAQADKNARKAEAVVAAGGDVVCPPGKLCCSIASRARRKLMLCAEPAAVDAVPSEIAGVGKRALSERTPEPDELAKRVKLTADAEDTASAATIASA